MLFEITKEEQAMILLERKKKEAWNKKKKEQALCPHKKAYVYGRGGHNNDTWYRCPDCGYEWDN